MSGFTLKGSAPLQPCYCNWFYIKLLQTIVSGYNILNLLSFYKINYYMHDASEKIYLKKNKL